MISGDELNRDGVFDAGETWVFVASYEATQDNIDDGGAIEGKVTFDTDQTDPQVGDRDDHINNGKLTITSTVDKADYAAVGEELSYEITLTNVGNAS